MKVRSSKHDLEKDCRVRNERDGPDMERAGKGQRQRAVEKASPCPMCLLAQQGLGR